ncbi:TonB-dependent receptor plug domain-containing protein [Sandaracinus amylolyticus]|uniref:TonB-dependent receptor plug domain-containing protein n=1 Tax=Sandaracinus amylolyticus TaxID=927083 RepID=UPI001F361FF4|nr:TonB-dependent receptor [Sandaracinus amylolyticus]UJR83578.1 Hypothetical protein I5071_56460 [Sandaracinus amylolyticus]
MKRVSFCVVVLALSGSVGVAHAQPGTSSDEMGVDDYAELSLEELLGDVVSASQRRESLFRAPANVTVIEPDDIRASGARSVPELLRSVPGVQVIATAPGNYLVSMRGMGGLTGNNLVVLLDGVQLNSPVDGEVDWSTLPVSIDDIARIEVVRGPVSPIYGANAYTGMIRIDTNALPEAEEARGGARVVGGIDSAVQPAGEVSTWFRGRRGPVSASVQAHATLDDHFRTGETVDQPGLRALGLGGRIGIALDERIDLTLDTGAAMSERSALDYLVLEPEPQLSARGYGRLALTMRELAPEVPRLSFWTRGRWSIRRADQEQYSGFSYDDTTSLDGQIGTDLELALPYEIDVLVGADAGGTYVDAPFVHPDENGVLRGSVGVYVNADVDIAEMFNIGAAVRTDVSPFADGPQVSVRASAMYFQPNFSIRIIGASAYRNPTYVEVASRFRDPNTDIILLEGTAGLALPRVDSLEAILAAGFDGRFSLRASAYVARAMDLVVGDFTPLTRKTFRTDDDTTVFAGGEVELDWTITDDVTLRLGGAGVGFLTTPDDPAVTVGVAEHNSLITATAEVRGRVSEARLDLSAGATFFSERQYNVRVGLPPQLVRIDVPHGARLHGTASWRPVQEIPLDLRLITVVHLPHELVESPLPSAGRLGSRVLLGVDIQTN